MDKIQTGLMIAVFLALGAAVWALVAHYYYPTAPDGHVEADEIEFPEQKVTTFTTATYTMTAVVEKQWAGTAGNLGTFRFTRINNIVHIDYTEAAAGTATAVASFSTSSSAPIIPAAYRPDATVTLLGTVTNASLKHVRITIASTGVITVTHITVPEAAGDLLSNVAFAESNAQIHSFSASFTKA